MKAIDEIKNIAPDLLPYLDSSANDLPENYFIHLQDAVWEKLGIEMVQPPSEYYFHQLSQDLDSELSKSGRITMITRIAGIAAAILLLISVGSTFLNASENEDQLVDPELALFYLEQNIDQWNIDLIAEFALTEADIYTTEDELLTSYLDYLGPEEINFEFLEEIE